MFEYRYFSITYVNEIENLGNGIGSKWPSKWTKKLSN